MEKRGKRALTAGESKGRTERGEEKGKLEEEREWEGQEGALGRENV